jgi:hypothetical protein
MAGVLTACQLVGPSSIQLGRLTYNEVIEQTGKEQTFANIIRVFNHEPTTFVDVSQISATVQFQGIAMGGVTNIGGTSVGNANLSLQYQESPTIQYQPLSGQALIAQLITPITVDSLTNLTNSDWPLMPLLTFSVDRISPGYSDYFAAINTISALDSVGAVTLAPVQVEINKPKNTADASGKSKQDLGDKKITYPALTLVLHKRHPANNGKLDETEIQNKIGAWWCRLNAILQPSVSCTETNRITFRVGTSPLLRNGRSTDEESVRLITRSAYGALKASVEPPDQFIKFLNTGDYDLVRKYNQTYQPNCDEFYFMPSTMKVDDHPGDNPNVTKIIPSSNDAKMNPANLMTILIRDRVTRIIERGTSESDSTSGCLYTTSDFKDADLEHIQMERQLFLRRRFILVIKSEQRLPNAYVAFYDGRYWYSIAADDEISKKNFLLVGQLLIIQASASPPLSLTPTVSVGGTR